MWSSRKECLDNKVADNTTFFNETLAFEFAEHRSVVKEYPPEGRVPAVSIAFQKHIARASLAIEWHTYGARVEDLPFSSSALHWQMRVPGNHDLFRSASQGFLHVPISCAGKYGLVRAACRPVHQSDWGRIVKS